MIVFFDHLSETMEEDWSLNCGLHHLMVFFYCIKRGMYRLRLCLWLRFLWWWLRHNYWHTDDGVWAEVGVGWEVSWTVGCEFIGPVGCTWVVMRDGDLSRSESRLRVFLNFRLWICSMSWLYLSGCERWRLSRSGSRPRAFLNFRLWICCTLVVLRDGEEGCDVVRSAGWEDKQGGALSWGSICDAKLCYISECEFCFQAFTYFMVL